MLLIYGVLRKALLWPRLHRVFPELGGIWSWDATRPKMELEMASAAWKCSMLRARCTVSACLKVMAFKLFECHKTFICYVSDCHGIHHVNEQTCFLVFLLDLSNCAASLKTVASAASVCLVWGQAGRGLKRCGLVSEAMVENNIKGKRSSTQVLPLKLLSPKD